jgi:Fe2+ or Zn2+ uptake regulation protein
MVCSAPHHFEQQLRARGIRPTRHRLAVLEVLHDEGMASAEELAAHKELKNMDRVTIYRTLKQLVVAGLVYETHAVHAGTHYQLVEHHTHTVTCVSCNRVESLSLHDASLEKKLLSAHVHGFSSIHAHALTFFGTCKACASVVR